MHALEILGHCMIVLLCTAVTTALHYLHDLTCSPSMCYSAECNLNGQMHLLDNLLDHSSKGKAYNLLS